MLLGLGTGCAIRSLLELGGGHHWATWTQEPALEGGGGAAAAPPHETLRSYLELCRSREPYKKATAIKQAESNM